MKKYIKANTSGLNMDDPVTRYIVDNYYRSGEPISEYQFDEMMSDLRQEFGLLQFEARDAIQEVEDYCTIWGCPED